MDLILCLAAVCGCSACDHGGVELLAFLMLVLRVENTCDVPRTGYIGWLNVRNTFFAFNADALSWAHDSTVCCFFTDSDVLLLDTESISILS